MLKRCFVGAVVLFAVQCGFLASTAFAEEENKTLVIRDVRIFDGSGVIPKGVVVVEGGKIIAVGIGVAVPEGAEIVDGTGLTLLPGLIDSHTHAIFPAMLEQALVFGVTTELDMFMSHQMANYIKKQQADGKYLDLADLRSAGTLVTAPGGHGTQYGMAIPTITDPSEAQDFVDARLAEGSDYIKIVFDNGNAYGISRPTVDKDILAAVIRAAHSRGKLAVVHIMAHQDAREAISAGADGLVHLFADSPPEPEFGSFVAGHGSFVIPTLTVLESATGVPSGASLIDDPHLAPFISPTDANGLQGSFPTSFSEKLTYNNASETVRQLKAAGVPILAGTDAPNPGTAHGVSIHRELELLVQAGLTPAEAIAAATSVPAEKFGLTDRGRITPGLRADLLLVRGDPTGDIKATRDIVRVWKLGVLVDREAYLEGVQRQRVEAERLRETPTPPGSS